MLAQRWQCIVLCRGQIGLEPAHRLEALVPTTLEFRGNEAVIWIYRFILATRMFGLEACLLQSEFGVALLIVTLTIAGFNGK